MGVTVINEQTVYRVPGNICGFRAKVNAIPG